MPNQDRISSANPLANHPELCSRQRAGVNTFVSVIICCFTEQRLQNIYEAIASVQRQTRPPDEVILAVDNNRPLFEQMQVEHGDKVKVVLNDSLKGLSATRNLGVATADGDLIAFLDDDAVAGQDWIENLIRPFENSNVMAVGGEAVPDWPKDKPPMWFPEEFDFIIGCTAHKKLVIGDDGSIRNVTGSNMAFRKEVFEKIGLWDTELGRGSGKMTGGEEADICLKIKSGIPHSLILFEPRAIVTHKVHPSRATLGYVFNFSFREGTTRAKLQKATSHSVDDPLHSERAYLRRIIFGTAPRRLIKFYNPASVAQLGVVVANLALIAAGYLLGKYKYRSFNP